MKEEKKISVRIVGRTLRGNRRQGGCLLGDWRSLAGFRGEFTLLVFRIMYIMSNNEFIAQSALHAVHPFFCPPIKISITLSITKIPSLVISRLPAIPPEHDPSGQKLALRHFSHIFILILQRLVTFIALTILEIRTPVLWNEVRGMLHHAHLIVGYRLRGVSRRDGGCDGEFIRDRPSGFVGGRVRYARGGA